MSPLHLKIHEDCIELCRRYVKAEPRIIAKLQEIARYSIFKKLEKKSLYLYALEECGLSEGQAYTFASIANKANQHKCLSEAIQQEKLSISKAHRLSSTINEENSEELVRFAETHTKDQIEREVRRRNPKAAVREKIKPLSEKLDELHTTIDLETGEAIRRAQDLLAQRYNTHLDIAATLKVVIQDWVEKNDPLIKAQRAAEREASKQGIRHGEKTPQSKSEARRRKPNSNPKANPKPTQSPEQQAQGQNSARAEKNDLPLTAAQIRAVDLRDQRRCTYKLPNGTRCEGRRWIHYHHIVHRKDGGSNDPENLTTLCTFHHDLVHQLSFPQGGMESRLRSPIRPYSVQ